MSNSRLRSMLCRAAAGILIALASSSATFADDGIVAHQAAVRLTPGASIDAFNARYQTSTLRAIASRDTYLVRLLDSQVELDFVEGLLRSDPQVRWAELNYVGDAPEGSSRHFYFNVGMGQDQYNSQAAWLQINLDGAAPLSTGAGIRIAVIDTGIDADHPALVGRVSPDGWDFLDNDGDTRDLPNGINEDGDDLTDEMVGHGTHIAGILARIAPAAQLIPLRVLDTEGNTDNFIVAEAIYHAIDHGAHVINLSLGSTYKSDAVEEAIAEAAARGIAVVASAGNANSQQPEYPALIEGAFGVTSLDALDQKSAFSNFNALIALSAPGEVVYSTIPGNRYAAWSGTSMATPMVAASVALLLARHPEWPANVQRVDQVRSYLSQTAANIDAANPGYPGMLGAGRLNVGAAVQARLLFDDPAYSPTGAGATAIASGDFDADGRPDAAVLNAGERTVTILRNSGIAGFVQVNEYPLPAAPAAIVSGDFDRDGHLDLAIAGGSTNYVAVLRGLGSSAFAAPLPYSVAGNPAALAAADINGDGALDLAIACEDADRVVVLGNDGTGDFAVRATVPVGEKPVAIACADVDQSLSPDLITANRRSNSVTVLRSIGGFAFSPATTVPVGDDPRSVAAGDLDGDGRVDLAVANHDSDTVTTLHGLGGGAFSAWRTISLSVADHPQVVALADVDCDGRLDIAVGSSAISVYVNAGQGAFGGAAMLAVADASALEFADVDLDRDVDLLVALPTTGQAALLANIGCTPHRLGDMDCDGVVTNFDVDGFLLAIMDATLYAAAYPDCDIQNADFVADGLVNNFDIDGFLAALSR